MTVNDVIENYYKVISRFFPGDFDITKVRYLFEKKHNLTSYEESILGDAVYIIEQNIKQVKTCFVVNLFLQSEGKLTNKELSELILKTNMVDSNIPKISSSSIQRYLTDNIVEHLFDKKIAKTISTMLEQNRKKGYIKGGINSSNNNLSIKTSDGKFIGSIPSKKTQETINFINNIIETQAKMYLEGKSFSEIAEIYTISTGIIVPEIEVKRNVTVKLKHINEKLYQQVSEKKIAEEANKEQIALNEILTIYNEYVIERKSIKEIAQIHNYNASTISRKLNMEIKAYKIKYPDIITDEMIEAIESVKQENTQKVVRG